MPCYNEERRWRRDAFADFAARAQGVELLFVDDGSRDRTGELLASFCEAFPGAASLLRLPRNSGKAEAVRQGFLAAFDRAPAYVGYWDADLATPLSELADFEALLARRPQTEMVLGSRVKLLGWTIERRELRHYVGRFFATVVSVILRLPVYDTQCGAKLFRLTPTLREIFARPFTTGWVFDVEIVARLIALRRQTGGPGPRDCIFEMPLRVWRDVPGSKVKVTDLPPVMVDLWRIHRFLSRTRRGQG